MEELVAGDAEGEGKPGVALATEGVRRWLKK